MTKPLCVDLFCGLGGWTEGFLAEGWNVVGFDIEQHIYGEHRYPAQLVIQDVRTIHGKQFKDAAIIVASSPCPEYSYMAMPWSRAKQIATALRGKGEFPEGYEGSRSIDELNHLFEQPKRIQREAIGAAGGRFIPLIQENVRGAIPWVGRSQWHYGSFHLWGDVPALMPTTGIAKLGGGASWYPPSDPRHRPGLDFTRLAGNKNDGGGSWFGVPGLGRKVANNNPARGVAIGEGKPKGCPVCMAGPIAAGLASSGQVCPGCADVDGVKQRGSGPAWFDNGICREGSKSSARKAASARIAKIPFPLASHIARAWYPISEAVA